LASISFDAFANTGLNLVNIPSTVNFIGQDAFKGTELISFNFCAESDLTGTFLLPERKVCYSDWRTPLPTIANGPIVGETVYASAFERELPTLLEPRNWDFPEYEGPIPEEYVYRVTKQPNVPVSSVDHQPIAGYESLSSDSQTAWYGELGFTDSDPYQFTWKAFVCVPATGYVLSKPTGLNLSYVSREDGVLLDGGFNDSYDLTLQNAAMEWQQNAYLGQTLRSAVGSSWTDGENTARYFHGTPDPLFFTLIWGFLDVNGSCGAGETLKALTIMDSVTASAMTSKSFEIPEQRIGFIIIGKE
jgi:hypothetical protein